MTTYVIVSCTNRKRLPVLPPLRLGVIDPGRRDRLEQWVHRLATVDAPSVAPRDLYGGSHWQEALSLVAVVADLRLLVASAGYGLVDAHDSRLKAYSATYTPGHADSVPATGNKKGERVRLQEWWRGLCGQSPASVGLLANVVSDARDTLVVVSSPWYVAALERDLITVAERLGDDRVTIISLGLPASSPVYHLSVNANASLEHHRSFSGTRSALNVGIAKIALSRLEGSEAIRPTIQSIVDRETHGLPPPHTWNRTAHSDTEVTDWIRDQLEPDPNISRTRLLERFRSEDRACEQKRFARLFDEVRASDGRRAMLESA